MVWYVVTHERRQLEWRSLELPLELTSWFAIKADQLIRAVQLVPCAQLNKTKNPWILDSLERRSELVLVKGFLIMTI